MKITPCCFRIFFTGFFILCGSFLFAQDGLPGIVQHNGTVSAGNCWVVDTDSLRGNYAPGNTTMTITGPAGTRFGIFLDSIRRRSDNDTVRIHDGNSINAPVLTYFTAFSSPLPPWSVKSSSNVITIYFHAHNDLAVPNIGWRLGLRTITNVAGNMPSFLPVFQTELSNGMMELADYDNDGDKDLLANGLIYQNLAGDDSAYLFNRLTPAIGNWSSSKMASADFNADGIKDFIITGVSNLSGTYRSTTALYRNNGNNSFTRITTLSGLIDLSGGAVAITDLNNDGKPDITYTGSTDGQPANCLFKVFINTGNFGFTELTTNLPGLIGSSMDWKDYDNDGDPDLLINGYNNSGSFCGIYKNGGAGSFSSVTLPPFFQTSAGTVRWLDVNNDNKIDFINTGVRTPGNVDAIVPEFLINNGSDNFTRLISNLPARGITNLDVADYDNDGDPDLIYSGLLPSSPESDVAVYRNNGSNNFTRVSYRQDVQCLNTVKWIDLNGDNKKDLFICGRGNIYPSYVLVNMGADSFRLASYPFTGYANGGGGSSVLVEDLNNDGLPDFLFAGLVDDQDCAEGNLSTLIFSEAWKRKPFTAFKQVFDLRTIPGSAVSAQSFWRWGDVNNDGKADVLLTLNNEPLRVFKNEGNNLFSLMYSGFPNPARSNEIVGVIDIDNDNSNELWIAPNKLYKWNGTSFTTLYETNSFACEGGGVSSCQGYADFGDFNKDGFKDVVFTQGPFVYVLRNNRTGRLVNDYPSSLTTLGTVNSAREVKWMDYDSDGDDDLITREGIFESTSWGGLRLRGANIQDFGNIAVSDFNQDGKKDVLCLNRTPPDLAQAHIYYNQQGTSFFQEIAQTNFIYSYGGSYINGMRVADLDNDGDDDIVYGTAGSCTFSGVYINRSSEAYPNLHAVKPNGGEVYASGVTIPVRWTGSQLSNGVKIELSQNNGTSYSVINAAATGNSSGGQYNWTINALPSTQCKIRITDNGNGTLLDSSDAVFTITNATALPNIIRNNEIKIYPNPSTGVIYCYIKNIPAGKPVQVNVFDTNGRLVLTAQKITDASGLIKLDLHSTAAGFYLLQLRYNNLLYGKQLIIQH